MSHFVFTVPGRIIGKGRPRFAVRGGFAQVYTPAKTRTEEQMIASHAKQAAGQSPPLEGPVWLDVLVVQCPPPSWSKSKVAASKWIVTRPDFDNAVKGISDACNGILYGDDNQIAKITAERVWRSDVPERVVVTVKSLQQG